MTIEQLQEVIDRAQELKELKKAKFLPSPRTFDDYFYHWLELRYKVRDKELELKAFINSI